MLIKTDLDVEGAISSTSLNAIEDSPTSTITLDRPWGRHSNMDTANASSAFNLSVIPNLVPTSAYNLSISLGVK